jgi:hypothetical protein
MEENKEINESQEPGDASRTRVGFPQAAIPAKPRSKGKIIVLIVILLLLLGAGAWFVFGMPGLGGEANQTPTPSTAQETTTPSPTVEPIDREEVSIHILNGTGIPGSAGDLQEALEGLGYSDIETGNAENYDNKSALVSFDSSLTDNIRQEILEKLEDLYEDVDSTEESLSDFDVIITTGTPIGYKATVAPTKGPSATKAPTTAATGSVSPTGGTSPTLTPTP